MTWRVVCGTAVGTSHKDTGAPCQDRVAWNVVRTPDGVDFLIAVVCDGAGSAIHGERGAEASCEAIIGCVTRAIGDSSNLDEIDDEQIKTWFLTARDHVRALAREEESDLREYSCTALVAVVGAHQAICAQIGDGAIVVSGTEGAFEVACWPEGGEYANQTFFITDDAVAAHVHIRRFDNIRDIFVFSDGLQRLALHEASKSAHAPFFAALVTTVRDSRTADETLNEQLRSYLNSDVINSRTDDDKSLVIGCRL